MIATKSKFVLWLATGGPAGHSPVAPGTCGTLVGVPFSLGLNWVAALSLTSSLALLLAFTAGAIWVSGRAAALMAQKDPSRIVIDEIIGFLIANYLAPARALSVISAFVIFRFFDIAKVYPASRIQKLPGGTGIVLDDIVAGLYTFAIVQLLSGWRVI